MSKKARQIIIDQIGSDRIVGEIEGNNRHVVLTETALYFGSVGVTTGSFFGKQVKHYPLESITSVDVTKRILLTDMEISMGGGVQRQSNAKGFLERASNENLVAFAAGKFNDVQKFASLILATRDAIKSKATLVKGSNSLERLTQLKSMLDAGLISIEEFGKKKEQILDSV